MIAGRPGYGQGSALPLIVLIQIKTDAAQAVAALFCGAAVGVPDGDACHNLGALGRFENQGLIKADTTMAVCQIANPGWVQLRGMLLPTVQQHEIIAGPLHFMELPAQDSECSKGLASRCACGRLRLWQVQRPTITAGAH